jgi:hypothetical protein
LKYEKVQDKLAYMGKKILKPSSSETDEINLFGMFI